MNRGLVRPFGLVSMKRVLFLCALAASLAPAARSMGGQDAQADARAALMETLAAEGIELDLEAGCVRLPAEVLVREELLEYLLVGPGGQAHESLFHTRVTPSLVNAALLTLGLEPGTNARWELLDPPPTEEERAAGKRPYRVLLPEGDGLFLYAAWREGEEVYWYRVEDLLTNLATGRSMRRHPWVYLGSRFASPKRGEPERFVADYERNLINLAFFYQGNTLATAALPQCVEQTIWVANAWLLPPRGTPVSFILARRRLERLPDPWRASLPVYERPPDTFPGADDR